jgi:hypothetical protein
MQSLAFVSSTETEELLQTTNLHNTKISHYDSSNYKKPLVINGKANSNCNIIDDKTLIQSGLIMIMIYI